MTKDKDGKPSFIVTSLMGEMYFFDMLASNISDHFDQA